MSVNILVVDDEPLLERLINQRFRQKIQSREYVFTFARNGKEAWEKLQANPQIDIVLTDLNMPEMDGFTLLSLLSKTELNDIKTVIVSAYGDFKNMRKAMNVGVFDFISKPIDFQDLEVTISRTIRSKSRKPLAPEQKGKKPRLSSLVSLARNLNVDERFETVLKITETFTAEDLDDLKEELEAQRYIASENEYELDLLATEDYEREQRGETPKSLFEEGFIEARYTYKTLATGEKKRYGPYYYKRWREGGKLRSLYLGTEDPRKKQVDQPIANLPVSPATVSQEMEPVKPKPPIKLY